VGWGGFFFKGDGLMERDSASQRVRRTEDERERVRLRKRRIGIGMGK